MTSMPLRRPARTPAPPRAGTQRARIHAMLLKGTSVEAAMVALGWSRAAVVAAFHEIARLAGSQLYKSADSANGLYMIEGRASRRLGARAGMIEPVGRRARQ